MVPEVWLLTPRTELLSVIGTTSEFKSLMWQGTFSSNSDKKGQRKGSSVGDLPMWPSVKMGRLSFRTGMAVPSRYLIPKEISSRG